MSDSVEIVKLKGNKGKSHSHEVLKLNNDKSLNHSLFREVVIPATDSNRAEISRYFDICLNRFQSSFKIERFCITNGYSNTFQGISDGSFSIKVRQPEYKTLHSLQLVNSEGKETFNNHLVIPEQQYDEISALRFINLDYINSRNEEIEETVNKVNSKTYEICFNERKYIISGLIASDFQLKAKVSFRCGVHKLTDIINIYVTSNRKRLIDNLCHLYERNVLNKDMERILEILEGEQTDNFGLSEKAQELLDLFESLTEMDSKDIADSTGWNSMKINRSLKELDQSNLIERTGTKRPYKYRFVTTFVDNQGVTS